MEKPIIHCSKCGAACAKELDYCEFCGERRKPVEASADFPSIKAAIESSARPPVKQPEKTNGPVEFDFVRATQRTILILLSGVFLFLCPVPVPPFYKALAVLSAFLGLWSTVLFRVFGLMAMASALSMCVAVYELGYSTRQLFTEKDYYSQGAKGPIPEWALFKKTLFQSLSGFECVCLFAAFIGAAYIFWIGFYAVRIRKNKIAEAKK